MKNSTVSTSTPEISPQGENTDPLAFRIFNEIGIIAQISGNMLERALPSELKLPHFLVLNHFVRLGEDSTPNQLARAFQISKGAMTNTLQRLESQGLISISPDASDGRVKRVTITPAGRQAREAGVAAVAPFIAEMHHVFDAEELSNLLPHLSRMRQWLGTQRDDLA